LQGNSFFSYSLAAANRSYSTVYKTRRRI